MNTTSSNLPTRIAVVTTPDGCFEQVVSLRSADNVSGALRKVFPSVETFPFDERFVSGLRAWQPDVVYPAVAHGAGEFGALQSLLETLDLPFVGSGSTCTKLCGNRLAANQKAAGFLLRQTKSGVRTAAVPPFIALAKGDDIKAAVIEFCQTFARNGVLVIRPARAWSSMGIAYCTAMGHRLLTKEEVFAAVATDGSYQNLRLERIVQSIEQASKLDIDGMVILGKYVHGTSISVGVLEDPVPRALPVIEIADEADACFWHDRAHTFFTGGSEYMIPARLSKHWLEFAQDTAIQLHKHFGCNGLSMTNFVADHFPRTDEPKRLCFQEIISPNMTTTSLFPRAAKAASISMPDLVQRLVLQAWSRRACGVPES